MAQVVVELTGDEAKLLRSLQKVVEQNAKTKDSFKGVAKESKDASSSMSSGFSDVANKIVGATSATALLGVGMGAVAKYQQAYVERAQESLALVKEMAKAQQEAAKNMAGSTPQNISDTLQKEAPGIAERTGFSNLANITQSLGAASGSVGEKGAVSAVEAAAKLTLFKPDDLQTTATALADIMKAGQMEDARQAGALLLTTGAKSRPEDIPKLASALSQSMTADVAASPNQNPLDVVKQNAAMFAVLSKVDKQGESTATANIQLGKVIEETFTPSRDQTIKRDERIAELLKEQAVTVEEQVAIDRAKLSIQPKQAIVNRLLPTDMSIGAQDARLDLREAQASLVRATKASGLDDKQTEELRRLQAQKQLVSNDPGDKLGRMQAIGQSPELMRTVEANLTGEAKFKAIMLALFDANSVHTKELNEAIKGISTDAVKFDDVANSIVSTPQQKLALASLKGEASNEIAKFTDLATQQKATVDSIVAQALKQNPVGGLQGLFYKGAEWVSDKTGISAPTPGMLSTSPEQAINSGIMMLKSQQADIQATDWSTADVSKMSQDIQIKNKSLQGSIDSLERMKAAFAIVPKEQNPPVEQMKNENQDLKEMTAAIREQNRLAAERNQLARDQNDKVDKQNAILLNTKDTIDQSSRPQAPQIRAMNAGVTTN